MATCDYNIFTPKKKKKLVKKNATKLKSKSKCGKKIFISCPKFWQIFTLNKIIMTLYFFLISIFYFSKMFEKNKTLVIRSQDNMGFIDFCAFVCFFLYGYGATT